MFYLFVVSLTLSALLVLNALASLGAEALWRVIGRAACRWSARTRAQIIFSLRVFPLAGALIGVAALILPSYLTYEPWPIDDVVTTKIAALTLISALGIGLAARRGLTSWRVTQRLAANWTRNAEAVRLAESPVPVYRICHPFPVVAVVGVSRPRFFIASQIFDSLSHDEITAVVRHEAGHLAMRDNLKRVLMRICRDVLMIAPCGRSLDRDWGEATEAAADEHAARASPTVYTYSFCAADEQCAGDNQQRDRQSREQFTFGAPKDVKRSPQREMVRGIQEPGDIGGEVADRAEVARKAERRVNRAVSQQERQHRHGGDTPGHHDREKLPRARPWRGEVWRTGATPTCRSRGRVGCGVAGPKCRWNGWP